MHSKHCLVGIVDQDTSGPEVRSGNRLNNLLTARLPVCANRLQVLRSHCRAQVRTAALNFKKEVDGSVPLA